MGRYLDRLRNSENDGIALPTKPTNGSIEGFVGVPSCDLQKSELRFVGYDGSTPRHSSIVSLAGNALMQEESLIVARAKYFDHINSCPHCSVSWGNTAGCSIHADLWRVYLWCMAEKFGADLVYGVAEVTSES